MSTKTTPHTITYVAGEPSRFGVASGGGGGAAHFPKAAERIAASLRQFVADEDQQLTGLESEYLIQVAQFLENLNER